MIRRTCKKYRPVMSDEPDEMGTSLSAPPSKADDVRAAEHDRLRALVKGHMEAARLLHTDDFQLVTPFGDVLSKEQYLGAIAGGDIRYLIFECDSPIEVRMYGDVALIRYRSQIEIAVQGQEYPRGWYWHTDTYETRDGRWQIVWSQATRIMQRLERAIVRERATVGCL